MHFSDFGILHTVAHGEWGNHEARNRRIFDMWMACYTQEEIGEKENLDKAQINRICCEMAGLPKLNKSDKAAAEHATDFQIPLYNVWKQKQKQTELNYPIAPEWWLSIF